MAAVDDVIRELMVIPPPDFVAARNALVKQLRADGDGPAAAAVGKIRRPSWNDHALNVASASDAVVVHDFLDTGAVLRAVQRGDDAGRGAPTLGDAMRAVREAQIPVVGAANGVLRAAGRSADAGGLTERLVAVIADDGLSAHLRDGVLGVQPDDGAAIGWSAIASATSSRRAVSHDSDSLGASQPAAERRELRAAVKAAERAREVAAEAAASAADDLRLARARRTDAAETLAVAQRDLERADAAVGAARSAHESASEALAAAHRELDRARAATGPA